MMKIDKRLSALLLAGASLLGACKTTDPQVPALLTAPNAEIMDEIKTVLAAAMDRASVELGPVDLTQSSVLSVLPPRLGEHETHSLATPTQFDLVKQGEACFLIRRDTGDAYALDGVACRGVE